MTLSQSAWTTSGDRVRQVVTVNGITASTPVIVVDVSLTGSDLEADSTVLDAWLNGPSNQNIEQGSNQLIFYSISAPTVNIPITIGVC